MHAMRTLPTLAARGCAGCGKTTWAAQHAKAHPDKRYVTLGADAILEQMRARPAPPCTCTELVRLWPGAGRLRAQRAATLSRWRGLTRAQAGKQSVPALQLGIMLAVAGPCSALSSLQCCGRSAHTRPTKSKVPSQGCWKAYTYVLWAFRL